jgi:hypothetical protein
VKLVVSLVPKRRHEVSEKVLDTFEQTHRNGLVASNETSLRCHDTVKAVPSMEQCHHHCHHMGIGNGVWIHYPIFYLQLGIGWLEWLCGSSISVLETLYWLVYQLSTSAICYMHQLLLRCPVDLVTFSAVLPPLSSTASSQTIHSSYLRVG